MGLSWHQKVVVLSKREVYWVSLGRVLWQRKQLIAALQSAALQLEEQTEGEPSTWLHQPGPLRTQVNASTKSERCALAKLFIYSHQGLRIEHRVVAK